MIAFASLRPLLLGIGNVLRGDDGLGRVVAEQLARTGELDGEILSVHQLTPELALPMTEASLVIMVDASREGRPGEVCVRLFSSPGQSIGAVGAHHITPEELAALTSLVYGHCPPVVVIRVTGADFSMGERLSLPVVQALSQVKMLIHQICTSGEREKYDDALDDVWHGIGHAALDASYPHPQLAPGRIAHLAGSQPDDASEDHQAASCGQPA